MPAGLLRFPEDSYANDREVCELLGARYPVTATPLGLLTAAALLPQDWRIRLHDLNVADLDASRFEWAELGLVYCLRNAITVLPALVAFLSTHFGDSTTRASSLPPQRGPVCVAPLPRRGANSPSR